MTATATTQTGEAPKTSRIGKRPVDVPKGVTVTMAGRKVAVKGAKGQLERELPTTVDVKVDGARLHIARRRLDVTARGSKASCAPFSPAW